MTREMQQIRQKSLKARTQDRTEAKVIEKTLAQKWFERLGRKS